MRHGTGVYRFGAFELHPTTGRLLREGQPVAISDSAFAILVHLVAHAPDVARKETLTRVGWRGIASTGSLEQAISRLRKALGHVNGLTLIETVPNRGYRFAGSVEEVHVEDATTPDGLERDVFHLFVKARRRLASFTTGGIAEARCGFAQVIAAAPNYAPAHIGMSTSCALAFDATRVATACDVEALTQAIEHGLRSVAFAPASGDAWSALGFARYLAGESDEGMAAAVKAVALEPGSWRHALRLGYVSWGEERLEAADTALSLRPRLAMAYWLKATVFIARGAFDAALAQLHDGCAAQDDQPAQDAAYPAVGLHLLRGLVLAARGLLDAAIGELEAELSVSDRRQIYWQECAANSWYALGGIRLRLRDFTKADAAFRRALEIAPGHLLSMAALGRPLPELPLRDHRLFDLRLAQVVSLVRENRHADAARACAAMLAHAPGPGAGWLLPVEPILSVSVRPAIWSTVLAVVQARATA